MENDKNNKANDRENFCGVCGRSGKEAGRMIRLPGGAEICVDCVQKMMDSIDKSGFDLSNPGSFPGMPFMGMPFGGFKGDGKSGGEQGEPDDAAAASPFGGGEDITVLPPEKDEDGNPEETEGGESADKKGRRVPSVSIFNLADLQGLFGGMQGRNRQVKRRAEGDKEPVIDPARILPPHRLKALLDEYVVGQEQAKKIISVAVYNHYKRVMTSLAGKDDPDDVKIEKSNILMIGPTGCGKTHIVRTLAGILDVPLAVTDATSLTEAGYIGDDIESVLSKLLSAADNDLDRAEVGIVFIDEIDKIAKKNSTRGRDVSGESVQQGLLKMLEGCEMEVPVGSTSKSPMVPLATMNTRNILFICAGAFPDLEDIIKERLAETTSVGFRSELKDKYEDDEDILSKVNTEDLRKFGMIPEFLGRLPIVCSLSPLSVKMLVRVLKEPKNAILKQYQKLLEMDEVKLIFEDDALYALAERAKEKKAGARGLRSIIEEIMLDIMYEIPKDDNIGTVTITKDYVEKKGAPVIGLRGLSRIAQRQQM